MTTEEALQEIIRRLQLDCAQEVSEGSGNSISTVYNWRNHGVKKPHLQTFGRFLKYYGYQLEVIRSEEASLLNRVTNIAKGHLSSKQVGHFRQDLRGVL